MLAIDYGLTETMFWGLQDKERREAGLASGGFPTPAAAMGHLLLKRLRDAGLYFNILSVDGEPVASTAN